MSDRREERLTQHLFDCLKTIDFDRISLPGVPGIVEKLQDLFAAYEDRIAALEAALIGIREFAEGHHQQQPEHFWLHALQVDIPAMVDVALEAKNVLPHP